MYVRTSSDESNKQELNKFLQDSDKILKSISSTIAVASAAVPTQKYDKSYLGDLSNLASELTDDLDGNGDEGSPEDDNENDLAEMERERREQRSIEPKDDKPESVLNTVNAAVNKASNIVERGKTLAAGFKQSSKGIVDLTKNAAILTGVIGIDTIIFIAHLFMYSFKVVLLCVFRILDLPKCSIFYTCDVLMFFLFVCLISPMFIIDMVFSVEKVIGKSCINIFFDIIKQVEVFDNNIYQYLGIHIVRYPDYILNMCYDTSILGDTSGYHNSYRKLSDDIFVSIPKDISKPISDIASGVKKIFAFLKVGK